MHIVDRRLNPGSKSLENRQRFLRRAKALVQRAVKQSSQSRDIRDVMEGGEVSIRSTDGRALVSIEGAAASAIRCCPGNKSSSKAICSRPREGGGRPRQPARRGRGRVPLRPDARGVPRLFLDDLELPDLAKRRLAEAEHEGIRRAGYSVSGSPANISVGRTMRLAMARRIALRRPRPETIAELEAELAECDGERRAALGRRSTASANPRIPYIDPSTSATAASRASRSRWPRR